MTQAIDCAEEADQAMITERIIDMAWSQLQQLPGPMVEEPRMERESSSVEFGELDDSRIWGANDQTNGGVNGPKRRPVSEIDDIVVDGDSELFWDEDDVAPKQDVTRNRTAAADALEGDTSEADTSEAVPAPTSSEQRSREQASREPITEPSVFGEFEDEEEIAVGKGVAAAPSEATESPCDLEHALHQEIVGLNDYLSEVLDGAGEDPSSLTFNDFEREAAVEVDESEDLEECVGNEQIDAADEEPRDTSPPCEPEQSQIVIEQWTGEEISIGETAFEESTIEPGVAEQTPPEEAGDDESSQSTLPIGDRFSDTEEGDQEVARDDSDLLVIEDDVEIRRIDAAKRYDSLDQTISVDFQAMLSRMRSRSE